MTSLELGNVLGSGAFGTVHKVMCDHLHVGDEV